MSYNSKGGRPFERASRSNHSYLINDPNIKELIDKCEFPKAEGEIEQEDISDLDVSEDPGDEIKDIVAIDGGYTEVTVREEHPSAQIVFFHFGILAFSVSDLQNLEEKRFIDPDDMEKLKKLERIKLALPARTVCVKGQTSLTHSIRKTLHEFFNRPIGGEEPLNKSLLWLALEEFSGSGNVWSISNCPHCGERDIEVMRHDFESNFESNCPSCGGVIWPCDILRLHEAIDDELGASGIFGYLVNSIEQLLIVHVIRIILNTKPKLLDRMLFIKDGPLAFFGQTANLHKPMRSLMVYLKSSHNIYLCGLEKSGAFVDHADQILSTMSKKSFRILTDSYIYKNIIPGRTNPDLPYGSTTYYSHKVIYHSSSGRGYLVNIPSREVTSDPSLKTLINPNPILATVGKLECDLYDSALVPVALANKLVSLANHPSEKILQRFAQSGVASS